MVIYNGVNKIDKNLNVSHHCVEIFLFLLKLIVFFSFLQSVDKDRICLMNGKSILCSSTTTTTTESNDNKEIEEKIEYATSAPLYQSNNICSQPIYVNVHNDNNNGYDRTRFSSEGSLTPTNHNHDIHPIDNSNYSKYFTNNVNNSNNLQQQTNVESNQQTYKKPIPPKPPLRHSSKLSTKYMTPETNKRSTLIFVKNTENSDFPPPPPEAFIRPPAAAAAAAEQCEKINDNLCCRYSVPNRHLVFCDNKECLKDYNQTIRQTYVPPAIYHSTSMMNSNQQQQSSSSAIGQDSSLTIQGYHKDNDTQYDNNNHHHHYQSSINLSKNH